MADTLLGNIVSCSMNVKHCYVDCIVLTTSLSR